MAKQNFLAGGFYGKLGATVGQRWKNQRTLRTYVIPENPRTPKQMANRNKFTAAVPFAQKGMSMNYRSPAFASETTTEWALRMSSAKYAMDLGQSDVAAIPVVPRGFVSAYTITGIAVESVTDATHAKLLLTGDLPAGAKHYSLMIYFSDGSRVGEYMLCHGETTAADNKDLTITCEDTTDLLTATLYGVIVSNDDIDAQTVTYSARIAIEKAAKPDFTINIDEVTKTATTQGKIHMTLQTSWSGDNLVGTFGVSDIAFSGERLTKAAVFAAGGESGATAESFTDNAATASNFTFNRTSGVIEFDITPSNVSTTHKYVGVFISFNLNFTNAYTDETSMASGFVSSSSGWAGGYLQSAFTLGDWDIATLESLGSIDPVFDMQGHWLGYCESEVKATAWLDASADALKALYDINQLHTTTAASFNPLGRLYVEDEDGNDYQSSTLAGSDFTCDGEDEPTYLEVRYRFDLPNKTINLELGDVANTVATLLNENNNRFGIYDADHIWTALPTMQFSGDLEF